jgi:hypothetical protein
LSFLKAQKLIELDPTMTANLPVSQASCLDLLDQVRPRHIQEARRFLSGEFVLLGNENDGPLLALYQHSKQTTRTAHSKR